MSQEADSRQSSSEHRLELVSSFLHAQLHAECACGWVGPTRENAQEAHADFDDHREGAP